VLSGCEQQSDVTVVKLAHGLDVTHPVHRAMELMADRAAEASSGRLRVDIYPSEQLGTERQALELLQIGSLGMTKVSAAVLENFAPAFKALSIPYVFRSEDHQFRVLDGAIGQDLLTSLRPFRLRGLCFYDAGSRSFYATRPIRTPDDLAGLKIRTQESPTAVEMVNALGGSATPIPWGELYTSLQQGVVDGAENNAPSFYLSGHYEVARYYSLNEHTRVPDVLLIGTRTWDRLTAEERRWLTSAVTESALVQRDLWREATQAALDAVQEAGVAVSRPDPAPFAARVEALYDAYGQDDQVYELIQAIRAEGS
jgi:tripartite ATP-independent transporter DctP family solute receptor